MDHWVLGVSQDQSLEIKEGQIVVAEEVSTLATVDVPLLKRLI
jgi:hypothetical protein